MLWPISKAAYDGEKGAEKGISRVVPAEDSYLQYMKQGVAFPFTGKSTPVLAPQDGVFIAPKGYFPYLRVPHLGYRHFFGELGREIKWSAKNGERFREGEALGTVESSPLLWFVLDESSGDWQPPVAFGNVLGAKWIEDAPKTNVAALALAIGAGALLIGGGIYLAARKKRR